VTHQGPVSAASVCISTSAMHVCLMTVATAALLSLISFSYWVTALCVWNVHNYAVCWIFCALNINYLNYCINAE